jgi:hypothetical protein
MANGRGWLALHLLGTVQCDIKLIERTKKMQMCGRIYYFSVSELLNMFRATHRPSSGAQNCNYSLWFYIHLWLPAAAMAQPSKWLATINVCKTRGCNYSFELLMMGSVLPETCWATKKHWNNKFYYMFASCWFFLWVLYYNARIHEHQVQCDILWV